MPSLHLIYYLCGKYGDASAIAIADERIRRMANASNDNSMEPAFGDFFPENGRFEASASGCGTHHAAPSHAHSVCTYRYNDTPIYRPVDDDSYCNTTDDGSRSGGIHGERLRETV